jgi:cytochrome c peroxidase
MSFLRRSLGAFALASPIFLWGCGGTLPESSTATTDLQGAGGATTGSADQQKKGEGRSEAVTPVAGTEATPPQAPEVKAEIKGGEATEGPTHPEFLYQAPGKTPEPAQPLKVSVPLGLEALDPYTPAANPLTQAKVDLGKQLYFDPRISKNTTVSCATCHNPAKGWTDRMPNSIGIFGQHGGRSAPTVLNTVYGKSLFWDGRAPSLEGQSQGPPQNKIEMGDQTYEEIVKRLRTVPGYQEQFQKVFGTPVTLDGVAKAIASFERTALSGGSAYDRYNGGAGIEPDLKALSESQKRGLVLFGLTLHPDDTFDPKVERKKANCTACHAGFNFTDEQFHNLGIGWDESEKRFADVGRFAISPVGAKNTAELGAFKTPTIRDIEKTGPYMHDGSLKTLEEVVEHYNKGGTPNPYLDKDMPKLNLSDQEKADVVAFMKALSGKDNVVQPPALPPNADGSTVDATAALTPPASQTAFLQMHRLAR